MLYSFVFYLVIGTVSILFCNVHFVLKLLIYKKMNSLTFHISCTISVLPCRLISSALWFTSPYSHCITLIVPLAKFSGPTLKTTGNEAVF